MVAPLQHPTRMSWNVVTPDSSQLPARGDRILELGLTKPQKHKAVFVFRVFEINSCESCHIMGFLGVMQVITNLGQVLCLQRFWRQLTAHARAGICAGGTSTLYHDSWEIAIPEK